MNCPLCASDNVRRSRRRGIAEKVRSWVGRRPYRCHTFMHRFFSSEKYIKSPERRSMPLSEGHRQPQVIEATIIDS